MDQPPTHSPQTSSFMNDVRRAIHLKPYSLATELVLLLPDYTPIRNKAAPFSAVWVSNAAECPHVRPFALPSTLTLKPQIVEPPVGCRLAEVFVIPN